MDLKTIYKDVINGKAADVEAGVQAGLDSGVPPEDILNKALIPAMDESVSALRTAWSCVGDTNVSRTVNPAHTRVIRIR